MTIIQHIKQKQIDSTNLPRQLDAWRTVEFYRECLAAATNRVQQTCLQRGDSENQVPQNERSVRSSRLEHAAMQHTSFPSATDPLTLHHINKLHCHRMKSATSRKNYGFFALWLV